MWVQSKNSDITSVSKAGCSTSCTVKQNYITDRNRTNYEKKRATPTVSAQAFRFSDELQAEAQQKAATQQANSSNPWQLADVHHAGTPAKTSRAITWDDADIDAPLPPSIWQKKRRNTTGDALADVLPDASVIPSGTMRQMRHLSQHFAVARFGFAAVYLIGCVAAGVLYQCFGSTEMEYLSYYLAHFIDAICAGTVLSRTLQLCSISLCSLTVILLCGLSALGLPLLFVVLFLKGLGSGTLVLAFFAQYQWLGLVYYLAMVGVAEAFLGTCLCALAVHAANNARAVLGSATGAEGRQMTLATRRLGRRYGALLLFMFAICTLCSVVSYFVLGYAQL